MHENLGILTRIVQKQISQKKAKLQAEQTPIPPVPTPAPTNSKVPLSNASASNHLALTAPYYNSVQRPNPNMQTIPQGYQQPISAPVAPNNMQASNGQAQMYQAAPQSTI